MADADDSRRLFDRLLAWGFSMIVVGALVASHDRDAAIAGYRDFLILYPDGTPGTRHCISNVIIEPEGDDRARVKSYVMVFQQTDRIALQPIIGGDYADGVARIDGVWRFVERRLGNDLIGNLAARLLDPGVVRRSKAN